MRVSRSQTKTDTNSCKTKDKGDQKLEVKMVPLCPSVAGIALFCAVLCCVVLCCRSSGCVWLALLTTRLVTSV